MSSTEASESIAWPQYFSAEWLGLMPWSQAEKVQREKLEIVLSDRARAGIGWGVILGVEHPPTITLGMRAWRAPQEHVPGELPAGWVVERAERGGLATLHHPGQLVVYPIVDLQRLGWNVRCYVDFLQEVTLKCLAEWGVAAWKDDQPGIFTSHGKVASIGIGVRRSVSRHGVALNVSNDTSQFARIRACGVSNAPLTSLVCHSEQAPPVEQVFQVWTQSWFDLLSTRAVGCKPQS